MEERPGVLAGLLICPRDSHFLSRTVFDLNGFQSTVRVNSEVEIHFFAVAFAG
jgi:hypothetical protein